MMKHNDDGTDKKPGLKLGGFGRRFVPQPGSENPQTALQRGADNSGGDAGSPPPGTYNPNTYQTPADAAAAGGPGTLAANTTATAAAQPNTAGVQGIDSAEGIENRVNESTPEDTAALELLAHQRADIEKLMDLMYRYYYTCEILESTRSLEFELASLTNGVKRNKIVAKNKTDAFPVAEYYKLGTFVFRAPSRESLSEINGMLHSYVEKAGITGEENLMQLRGSTAGIEKIFAANTQSISGKVDNVTKEIDALRNQALSYKRQAEDAYQKIEAAVEKSDTLFRRKVFINAVIENLKNLEELEEQTGLVRTHVEMDLANLYDVASGIYDTIREFRGAIIANIGEDNYHGQVIAGSNAASDAQIATHIAGMDKALKEARDKKQEFNLNPWLLERSTRISMLENLYTTFLKVLGERAENDNTGETETVQLAEVVRTEAVYNGKLGTRTALVVMTSKYDPF